MDAAERFERLVRMDELEAIRAAQKDPSIILCFDVETTLAYFDAKGWTWIREQYEQESNGR